MPKKTSTTTEGTGSSLVNRHWVLVLKRLGESPVVAGVCSDGRSFQEHSSIPSIWAHGFLTHCNMSGETCEIIEDNP